MPEPDNFNEYLPKQQPEEYSIEVPADQRPQDYNRIPSGDSPMGRIEQRGMAYSNLSRGRAPWWLLIIGLILFGSIALGLLAMGLAGSLVSWVLFVVSLLPLVILLQGILAKVGG
ncbi:hypothetical protein [Nodosilinea sp. P-1105]|uniref:hypothetical protein n=1 Tax=Nodosilinea sp. P-1105 TaxID=2546229 RepID=UPI00146AEB3C|nr:hypothetical protein [Nodosilinea sp. P-1105]NMF84896.1 hypothetical protein [Nodosilinea sp. P-1105]